MKSGKNFFGQGGPRRVANRTDAGPNTAACCGDLFVCRTGYALFKVNQTRMNERGMGVRVNKSRQHELSATVQFTKFFSAFNGRVAKGIARRAHRNNFPSGTQDGSIVNYSEFCHVAAAPRQDRW